MCSVHLILAALFCGMYSVQIVIAVYCGMRSIHEWALDFSCDYCSLSYCDTLHSVACISFLWQLSVACVQFMNRLVLFLCGLHTAFTFLLWQLFIMWHMFSSSVCDNSLCDMFSYCDSSSNGMCSADLIATNHRPDKLSTSCWSVVRGNKGSVKCSYANGSGKFQKYWLATFVTPNYRTAAATYAQLTVTITPSSVKCMEV